MNIKISIYCFTIFCSSLHSFQGWANPIVLKDSQASIYITPDKRQLFVDSSNMITIEDMLQGNFTKLCTLETTINHVPNTKHTYWIKIPITFKTQKDSNWVFEVLSMHTDFLDAYFVHKNNYIHQQIGHALPFFVRKYQTSNFIFEIPYYQNDTLNLLLKIKSSSSSSFDFAIKKQEIFTNYTVKEYLFVGIYFGILLVMAIYNLIIFLALREKIIALYVAYVLSFIFYSCSENGLGFQFIWPNHPEWNYWINNVLASFLLLIAFVSYSTQFLDLRKRLPNYFKVIWFLTGAASITHFIEAFELSISFGITWFIFLLIQILVLLSSIIVYRKGLKEAMFFMLGNSFVIVALIVLQLRNLHLVEDNLFTIYIFNASISIEVIIFSFALGEKLRWLKTQQMRSQENLIQQLTINQSLQTKVNRELEEKVKDRTKELEAKSTELNVKNIQLLKLNEKLDKMASELDYDNWSLKVKVKEEIKKRIISIEVTFEEFKEQYLDDKMCELYLANLKWGNGYKCKKCGHLHSQSTPINFDRKCTRCKHLESTTANTLFHGIRFSLRNAFFLVYNIGLSNNPIPLEQLSQILGISVNTCSTFKMKVQKQKKALTSARKTVSFDSLVILH